jgi:hypothetical protein
MSWRHLLSDDGDSDAPLFDRIDALFAAQRRDWPAFRDGEAALAQVKRKTLISNGQSIVVQMNPARRRSTQAPTDAKAIAARPCFLCPDNMPAEERGVALEDLIVLPNPFPILAGHCTIAGRAHRLQKIEGNVGVFLRLAEQIGPQMAALYNGPRCGASAPDHFHFQAARAQEIPILAQLPDSNSLVTAHRTFGRNVIILRGDELNQVENSVQQIIGALKADDAEEPMLNMLAHWDAGAFTVLVFPRAAHRPSCYFVTGPGHFAISPAVLEMCGVLVTTEPEDFERIQAENARHIYEEVSMPALAFTRLVADFT